jgi:hypothetical protein
MLRFYAMTRSVLLTALGRIVLVGACLFAVSCGLSTSAVQQHVVGPALGLIVTPSALSMGPTDIGSVNASEQGYSGTFSAASSDTTVATVVPNGPAQFIVTGVNPGTCTVTVSDTKGHDVKVSVSIQTTVIGGQ